MNLWEQWKSQWKSRFPGKPPAPNDANSARMGDILAALFGSRPHDASRPNAKSQGEAKASLNDDEEDAATASSKSTEPPTLYFAGWGYDDRQDEYTYRDEGKNVVVADVAGSAFVFRKMDSFIVCRALNDSDDRAALYLTYPVSRDYNVKVTDFDPKNFTRQMERRAVGRCMLCITDRMTQYQCAYLFFAPNGNGFALDVTEEPLVDFHWNDATSLSWSQLLTADPETLRPLCRTIFDTQINPRLTNPYIDPESLVEIPHEFQCGSEAELRRITVAIACTEPGLFEDSREPVIITYRAKTPTKRAYMMSITRGYDHLTAGRGRMQSLCDLALRLNTFTGITWEPYVENPNRLGHFQKRVHQVRVEVHPPSAHEQAESLLILADWLEGKIRPSKRLRLLGLDETASAAERT